MNLRDAALAAVRKGLVIFPIRPGGTLPLVKFSEVVYATEAEVAKSWRTDKSRKNYGVRCGWSDALQKYVVVLDIDVQHGGDKTIVALLNEHGPLPDTYAVTTPSGGMHFYFVSDDDVRNSAGKIGEGIDIRGHNGYVVGAGCIRDAKADKPGGIYKAVNDLPLAPLPDWIAAANKDDTTPPAASDAATSDDSPLVDVPLGARNDRLFKEACGLRGKGWQADAIRQAIGARNATFTHPLKDSEVDLICSQAAKYAPNAPSLHDAVYKKPAKTKQRHPDERPSNAEEERRAITLRKLSSYHKRRIEFLWHGYFPLHSVSVIAGDPGQAKTSLLLTIGSAVTTGTSPLAGADDAPQGSVVFATAEDSIDHTIYPRVEAAGGDPERFYILPQVDFNVVDDLESLGEQLDYIGDVRLLIIDPITAYMGRDRDGNSNVDVRVALRGLTDLAERFNLAVVGISHLNKDTRKSVFARLLGSVGWVAAPRAVYLANENPDMPGQSVVACAKTNFEAPEPVAFRKHIVDVDTDDGIARQVVTKLEAYDGDLSIDQLFRSQEKKMTAVERARRWLKDRLPPGELVAVADLQNEVEAGGYDFSWRTVKEAKKRLPIESKKHGDGSAAPWHWTMTASVQSVGQVSGKILPGAD